MLKGYMTVDEFNIKAQKLKILKENDMLTEEECKEIKNKLMEELEFVREVNT